MACGGRRGALPAAIFTAAYQATPVAKEFGTQGYLVTIIATLSLCILPRAKLVQLVIQNSVTSPARLSAPSVDQNKFKKRKKKRKKEKENNSRRR